MGSFADYLENKVLDHVFGAVTLTPPVTLHIGLSTTAINDAGGNITEPAGNNYSRVAVTNNATNFPAAVAGSKSNGAEFTFATPSGSWGTVVDFFISDAASGGNILGYGTLTAPQTIASGNIVKFASSSLTITLA